MGKHIKIFAPTEIGEIYTHWYELDNSKLNKITRRQTRLYKYNSNTTRESVRVFDTNPVIVTPFLDNYMVLNGKHRLFLALHNSYNVLANCVYTTKDIEHRVSKKNFGELKIKDITKLFENMHDFHHLCKTKKIEKIKDLDINFCSLS